jgi:glutathione synthase/RimK-type ligase-like ATP-grasp enzyme
MQKTVALVTYEAFPDLYPDDRLLAAALEPLGIRAVPAVWSRPDIDWAAFDAVVIRSPWDYFERAAEFRGWLDRQIATGVRLINGGDTLSWNFDKAYLRELGDKGVALVPTLCVARGEDVDLPALARARGWDDLVVKPTIAGGAYRTERFRLADYARHAAGIAETLRDRGVLVQPFLPEIVSGGELSLLFFDGVFSHAVRKRPAAGDFRVQLQFGGTLETVEVSPALVEQARACLAHTPSPTVYARVDGVIKDGAFLLMELEVFEPLMYLANHPAAPGRFAGAVARAISQLGR